MVVFLFHDYGPPRMKFLDLSTRQPIIQDCRINMHITSEPMSNCSGRVGYIKVSCDPKQSDTRIQSNLIQRFGFVCVCFIAPFSSSLHKGHRLFRKQSVSSHIHLQSTTNSQSFDKLAEDFQLAIDDSRAKAKPDCSDTKTDVQTKSHSSRNKTNKTEIRTSNLVASTQVICQSQPTTSLTTARSASFPSLQSRPHLCRLQAKPSIVAADSLATYEEAACGSRHWRWAGDLREEQLDQILEAHKTRSKSSKTQPSSHFISKRP